MTQNDLGRERSAGRIEFLLKDRNVTPYRAASMLGISLSHMYRLNKGEASLFDSSGELIVKISRTFDVSTDWLLGESDDIKKRYAPVMRERLEHVTA